MYDVVSISINHEWRFYQLCEKLVIVGVFLSWDIFL